MPPHKDLGLHLQRGISGLRRDATATLRFVPCRLCAGAPRLPVKAAIKTVWGRNPLGGRNAHTLPSQPSPWTAKEKDRLRKDRMGGGREAARRRRVSRALRWECWTGDARNRRKEGGAAARYQGPAKNGETKKLKSTKKPKQGHGALKGLDMPSREKRVCVAEGKEGAGTSAERY